MCGILVILFIVLGIALLFVFLVSPSLGKNEDKQNLKGLYIAHRGLHDDNLPENSLSAFSAALSGGYPIEIDIHITKDNEVVVFHDSTLKRMCGVDKRVEDITLKEIKQLRLMNSDCTIPTLKECLNAVDGNVPLLIEFKAQSRSTAKRLCQKADNILKEYNGLYFVQSFFPFVLYWYRKKRPNICRGQISTVFKDKKLYKCATTFLFTNVIARPNFISYNYKYGNKFVLRLNKILGATLICWTIKSHEDEIRAKESFSSFIFENYIP